MRLHEEIKKLAYELYEKSGRCEGRDLDNWFEAESIVKGRETGESSVAAQAEPQKKQTRRATTKKAAPKTEAKKPVSKATTTRARKPK
ncbi:MAG: DUF2934 domain-containing protein [Dissulfurispiraceae bacterium]